MEMKAAREIVPKWWDRVQKEWKAKGVTKVDFPEFGDREIGRELWRMSLLNSPPRSRPRGIRGYKMMQRWQEITASFGFKWARKWAVKK